MRFKDAKGAITTAALVRTRSHLYTHNSHTAYSLLNRHVTYIRDTYVESAQDDKLRSTIAHEMGHQVCGCTDEATANHFQAIILKNNL
jgi:hypothetical protein